ncbi:Uncharacterized protein Atu2659.1 [Durusdinium trenchii]|uniref:Uncharacterized protein Atu2659.1 n=2 Tax=Durusdinium trenchii TaxID=1381693 RepID=A0ABP0JLN4_9DINO
MSRRGHARGAVVLVAIGALTLGLTCSAFVPPAHQTSQPRLQTLPAAQKTSALALAGLVPLALAPDASVAQGWEMAVVGPLGLINAGLNLFKTALGIYALMSWLFAFGIIDFRNEIVQKIQGVLSSIIDPVLAPLRGIIPPLAGFDISFMVLWFVIEQAQAAAVTIMFGAATYGNYYY